MNLMIFLFRQMLGVHIAFGFLCEFDSRGVFRN